MNPLRPVLKALSNMRHAGLGLFTLGTPNTRIDFSGVNPQTNSAAAAGILWIARSYPEAPVVVRETDPDGSESIVPRHPLARRLERPNAFYSGPLMDMALMIEYVADGNAYLIKVRDRQKAVRELWWTPQSLMEPKWPQDGSLFLSHYDYRPGGGTPIRLEPSDVVHLRYGLDPDNPRKGRSPFKTLLREIWSDDEAAAFTASLLRNLGVPGVIIAPKDANVNVTQEQIDASRAKWDQTFSGDNRGRVAFMKGASDVHVLSFSPQQMDMSALRGIPEERIAAVLGIPAAVLGFGTGLAQTKVGATMKELREQAYESGIIPLQRMIAAELTTQLLPDYESEDKFRVDYDLSKVRVLQDDENAKATRVGALLSGGVMRRDEAREAFGLSVTEADKVYLMPFNVVEVPAGEARPALPAGQNGRTPANGVPAE